MTKQNPILPEPLGVNAAGIWDESYRSYQGRHGRYVGDVSFRTNNPYSDV